MAIPGGNPTKPKKRKATRKSTPVPGQTGNGSGPAPRARKPTPVPGQTGSGSGPSPAPVRVTHAPVTDVQSSGGDYGQKKATAFKKTAAYHGAVKAAYNELSPRQRRKRLSEAQARGQRGLATPEDETITKLHNERVAQFKRQKTQGKQIDAEERAIQMGLSGTKQKPVAAPVILGGGKDTKSDADMKRATDYQKREDWAVSDARDIASEKAAAKAQADADKAAAKANAPKKHHSVLGTITDTFHALYGGGKGKKGSKTATATARPALFASGGVSGGLPAKAVKNVGFAIADDPLHQGGKLLSDTGKSIIGAPAGIVDVAAHPEAGAKRIVADYKRRYGDLLDGTPEGERRFRERLKKDGVAPEIFDLASLAGSPVSSAAGKAIVGVAREGKLGARVARATSAVRPAVRLSGNIVHEPAAPKSVSGTLRGVVADKARKAVTKRRAKKATAAAHVREAVDAGQVTPVLERTPVIGRRSRARKAVAAEKSAKHLGRQAETRREVNSGAERNLAHLSRKHERPAFKYAMQLGLKGDDVTQAIKRLKLRKEQILKFRKDNPDVEIIKGEDEIPVIDHLIKNADKSFTPKLAKTVAEEKARGARMAEGDPGIDAETAALRVAAPQAEHLGVTREGTPTDQALKDSKAELKAAKKARKSTGGAVTRQERAAGRSQGRAEVRVAAADTKALRTDPEYVSAAQKLSKAQKEFRDAKKAHGNAHRNPDMWTTAERHGIEQRAATAERDVATARGEYKTAKATATERLSSTSTITPPERVLNAPEAAAVERPDTATFDPHSRPYRALVNGEKVTKHGPGRGWVDANGKLHTWFEEDLAHHDYVRHVHSKDKSVLDKGDTTHTAPNTFSIRSDGTIRVQSRSSRYRSDAELASEAIRQDPRLKLSDPDARAIESGAVKIEAHRYPDALNELEAIAGDELGPTVARLRSKTISAEDAAKTLRVLDSELEPGGLLTKAGRLDAGDPAALAAKIERQATKLRAELRDQHVEVKPRATATIQPRDVTTPPVLNRKPTGTLRVAQRGEAEALARAENLAKAEKRVARAKKNVKKAKKAKRMGERLVDAEPADQYLARVKAEADKQGLVEPGYHPSQKRPESTYGAFTTGGKKRAATPQEYQGELFRSGRESSDPRVYTSGLAQNIKRKFNWNMVAKSFDDQSYAWSKGKTLSELKDELAKRKIDPDSVRFWNPEIFRKSREKIEAADTHSELVHGEQLGDAHVHSALDAATIDWHKLATTPDEFNLKGGWSVVPKEVYDEIMADTHPSNWLGRGFDIVKGKASRLLLGNPVWLQFQIASNALLTGITGTGPIDALKAQAWWHKLSTKEREDIEPYLGIHAFHDDQTRLGAASSNRLVNAYRAFKTTAFYKTVHKGNPLDLIFRGDNYQNNFFRKAVLYSKVKRAAYKRMGENVGKAQEAQARIAGIMNLGPHEQMKEILANHKLFEEHAQYVKDFLGDYSTYTAKERRILGRGVMFYGFVRFSLRFMFYTMPAKHPFVASTMLTLGRLHHDELVRIFGTEPPPWELGNYYSPDGKFKIAVQRVNPWFNAGQFIDLDSGVLKPNQLAGLVPPVVQAAANYVVGKNIFMNKDWQIGGSTTRATIVSNEDRAKIFVADFLKGFGWWNTQATALDPKLRGKQGADSSVLFPSPVKYKNAKKKRENQAKVARQTKSPLELARNAFTPVQGGQESIITTQEYAAQQKKKKKGASSGSSGPVGVNIGGGSSSVGVRP